MSMGTDDIAEARAAREDRERIELESRHDAEYDLAVLGIYGRALQNALDAAKAQGEIMTSGAHVARVTYRAGVYTVTP